MHMRYEVKLNKRQHVEVIYLIRNPFVQYCPLSPKL